MRITTPIPGQARPAILPRAESPGGRTRSVTNGRPRWFLVQGSLWAKSLGLPERQRLLAEAMVHLCFPGNPAHYCSVPTILQAYNTLARDLDRQFPGETGVTESAGRRRRDTGRARQHRSREIRERTLYGMLSAACAAGMFTKTPRPGQKTPLYSLSAPGEVFREGAYVPPEATPPTSSEDQGVPAKLSSGMSAKVSPPEGVSTPGTVQPRDDSATTSQSTLQPKKTTSSIPL